LREINADKCIFFGTYEGFKVHLALFVDAGIVAAKSSKVINSIVKALNENFEITLGDCSNFVGMQICRDRVMKTMFIHQSAYAKKVIERFGMS
jgi:Reverse transcriptase (RNA-dependent DNA polymerase).